MIFLPIEIIFQLRGKSFDIIAMWLFPSSSMRKTKYKEREKKSFFFQNKMHIAEQNHFFCNLISLVKGKQLMEGKLRFRFIIDE